MGVEEQKRNPLTIEELSKKYPTLKVNWMRAQLPDGYIDWVYEIPETDGIYLAEDDCNTYEKEELKFIDYDFVKITPRESYMIMDAISYALDMLPNHDEYLYCNYSREELAKCAQRFGNLNLKNQW